MLVGNGFTCHYNNIATYGVNNVTGGNTAADLLAELDLAAGFLFNVAEKCADRELYRSLPWSQ